MTTTPTADDQATDRLAEAPAAQGEDRETCWHCRGTGKALRTADILAESLALFPTADPVQMDAFVVEFYRRLVSADSRKAEGDRLAPLFPADLTTGDALNSQGHRQRDALLGALVELITQYDPDHLWSGEMDHLVKLLQKAGRSHAAFRRPDGSIRGATPAEYGEVFAVLVGLLHDVFGERWLAEYDAAWTDAYWFAAIEMMHAAQHYRLPDGRRPSFGRMPRRPR